MTPGAPHPEGPAAQPLRSDAERNRERIIAAARTVFARDGLNASMASVVREGGVGSATMFRRFPTKEELVDAVFSDRMGAYADVVTVALEDPDPWNGFVGYIETACAMQAADNGFADVLTMTFPTAKVLEERRNRAYEGMLRLIERTKATGRLRADFDPSDLVLIHMANAGVVNATGDAAPDAWRRAVALIIQSVEAPARGPLPASPGHEPLYKAMLRAGQTTSAPPSGKSGRPRGGLGVRGAVPA